MDSRGGEGAAFGDIVGSPAGSAGGRGRGLVSRDVEDVQFAAGGGFDGVLGGGIVRDLVSVHDVVVPVPATQFEHRCLKPELANPRTGFRGLPREGDLALIVVPRTNQMDRLDVGGSAEVEFQLNGGHLADMICCDVMYVH